MRIDEDDYNEYLAHYGTPRHSGRYPWGSGDDPKGAQRNRSFLDDVKSLRNSGMPDTEIAKGFGMSTTQLRAKYTIALNEKKQSQISQAQRLKDKGYSPAAIAQRMGIPDSTVRAYLAPGAKDKADILLSTANVLKDQVKQKKYIDVGAGAETQLNISATKLNAALAVLKEQGYEIHDLNIQQVGTGKYTKYKILAPPGTKRTDVYRDQGQIQQISAFSNDGGRTYLGIHPPLQIHPDRVAVRYGKDGGAEADGVIYVRPGVKDVSLGGSQYAQVRIAVGDKHYMKGMAMYKDDLPKGVDLLFNTNKENTGNKLDAFKPTKDDKDNPFGSEIRRQIIERDKNGNEHVASAMNIIHQEGDWSTWSRNLSSQMLSKQAPSLAKEQLDKTYQQRLKEFDKLSQLTNPAVKKKLLISFGDETSKAAVDLKAAAISSRQSTHVILPLNKISPTEVYAPNYKDGERVVLIRHPHGGRFEIPEVTVNNKNPEGRKLLGNARDAIGIHHEVAKKLSGADFDGDTVIVIPNNSGKIKTAPLLEGLKDFDPQRDFPEYPGMKRMTPAQKQSEMGYVSNLITDMTIKGATSSELARAIRHSMVVIDAEKHNLNWKESERVNGIKELKKRYQGSAKGGASTLISRAGGEVRINERVDRPARLGGPIDKSTGKRQYIETGRTYIDNKGNSVPKKSKVERLAITEDAHILSSGTHMEEIYANHSNRLKALGDQARKEAMNTPRLSYSPSAKKAYESEVSSLNHKLSLVVINKPKERQAQLIANQIIRQKKAAEPNMNAETLKKIKAQALNEARNRVDAKGQKIEITAKEWEAIQAGAISPSKLDQILEKADLDKVRELATPKPDRKMTPQKTARANTMLKAGYTRAEVANALGVSLSTLDASTLG